MVDLRQSPLRPKRIVRPIAIPCEPIRGTPAITPSQREVAPKRHWHEPSVRYDAPLHVRQLDAVVGIVFRNGVLGLSDALWIEYARDCPHVLGPILVDEIRDDLGHGYPVAGFVNVEDEVSGLFHVFELPNHTSVIHRWT